MKTVAIVQARMGSTRLPNKVMHPICGTPMIGLLLSRLADAKRLNQIVLATSDQTRNDPLARYVHELGYVVYRGQEDDVLDRYYQAAKVARADTVVRVTGDCPLVDPALVDLVVESFLDAGVDYASNVSPPTYPNGLDVEAFSSRTLETTWRQATAPQQREHVTLFMRESGAFSQVNVRCEADLSDERWTVDQPEDLDVVEKVYEHFHPRRDFSWREVLAFRRADPRSFAANQHLIRNEGPRSDSGRKP